MPEVYDPVQLTKDATTFARSKFGRHYLAKLEARVAECRTGAVDLRLSRDDRADYGLLASEAQRQLDYFKTAQQTASNPNLLRQMAENFKKRMGRLDDNV